MRLLHIDSSILGANSVSRQMTQQIVDRLRLQNPDIAVTYRDLSATPLTHLTLPGVPETHPASAGADAEAAAHERLTNDVVLEEFLAADTVVIGAPMYNFSISSQLKAWIDRILVPRKTFGYSADGPMGLAGEKRVIVAISRGGYFPQALDQRVGEHAEAYLRFILGFIGITDPEVIVAEGIMMGAEQRQMAVDGAARAIKDLRTA